ncbi:MAG: hypothetical protein V2J26_05410 [Pacificimonas sp.]|jgi:hypothetical protein|nr:hypothetical protein [Pacificimonas sp.]
MTDDQRDMKGNSAPGPQWTAARQGAFLQALLSGASVAAAARAAGMSRQGVYRFRRTPRGEGFGVACDVIQRHVAGQRRLPPALWSPEMLANGLLTRRIGRLSRVTHGTAPP